MMVEGEHTSEQWVATSYSATYYISGKFKFLENLFSQQC